MAAHDVTPPEVNGTLALRPSPRDQFLALRKLGIGGSEIHHLFSEPPYGCARNLSYQKLGQSEDYQHTEQEKNRFRRGTLLEAFVADLYEAESGRKIRRAPHTAEGVPIPRVSKEHPWARVNADRIILAAGEVKETGVLEIKTANEFAFKKIQADGLPAAYLMQLQHAMFVHGYSWGSFAVLEIGDQMRLVWFDMQRNEQMIQAIIRAGGAFWANVQQGILAEPLPKPNDKRCASCLYRKTCRGEQFAQLSADDRDLPVDEAAGELVKDYADACQIVSEAETTRDAIRDQIEKYIGDQPGVLVPSVGLGISWKQSKPAARWDTKALEAAHPELAEKFKRPSAPTRPFKLVTL